MRLTSYTDYSIRVLIYLATLSEDRLVNIKEIAEVYQISKNHLTKVIYDLGKLGYIETVRGRNGGVKLALEPHEINIGEVIQKTEDDFYMAACFDPTNKGCIISSACKLKGILNKAVSSYLSVLEQYSLADIIENKEDLQQLFQKQMIKTR
ncbi:Rrf2 family nitric oxide-sensitive transcriptional repressor [Bacillus mesophilus]|uniref:HTH-type transcriptional regulator NsrR n=1 Tax=Bacillus mesophilus TaxID=1808955 RepID=A0A6M0Q9Q4_9BACI|nr:Rrf2 family transcriptional regulator [Bacillus mesophilus]MBM7662386.1 Rrf2 family nitric oxide-sensitive transcriptional repressor [Bacillus mesophilus]NEY72987.1 Rrf2 family transcriptional regulator [Bacillus mesophilus]